MRVAVITSSDSGYEGKREDLRRPGDRENGHGGRVSGGLKVILPDDRKMLEAELARIADAGRRILY